MEKQYRTEEQFIEITKNLLNGNWRDAADGAVKHGFYASDMIRFNKELELIGDLYDIAELPELTQRRRHSSYVG